MKDLWSEFVEELKSPSGIIAIASIIIGIGVSSYFYFRSIKSGRMSYLTEQIQVFDSRQISSDERPPLIVIDKDQKVIDQNVFAAYVKIWNAGNAEIKREDVRVPFRVILSGSSRILDLRMVSATRDNADGFRLEPLKPENSQRLGFNWEHFDPDEGCAIRIVYEGSARVNITIAGFAVGIIGPNDADAAALHWPLSLRSTSIIGFLMLGTLLMIFASVPVWSTPLMLRLGAFSVLAVGGVGIFVAFFVLVSAKHPPF